MVGYALLDDQAEPDPDSGLYKRRVFFLLPHDRDSLPGGLYREGAPRRSRRPAHHRGEEGGGEDPTLAERAGCRNRLPLLTGLRKLRLGCPSA
jgi:hypothetical protein